MGFVPESTAVDIRPKTVFGSKDDIYDDPSVSDLAQALWEQENVIGSFFAKEKYLPDEKNNFEYDAWSKLSDQEKLDTEFVGLAVYADDDQELEAVRKQVKRERSNREIIRNGGAMSFILGFPIAIADPISLLAIGGMGVNTYRAGRSILSSAMVTGSVVGVETAAQEAALHSNQLTRTFGESAINISAGVLLGGTLGATVTKLADTYGVDAQVQKALADSLDPERKIADGINPSINAVTTPDTGSTVGAAEAIGDVQVKGKVAKLATKLLGFDPLSRTITSDSKAVRIIATQLAENPVMMDRNTGQAVESLALLQQGKLATVVEQNGRLYTKYKQSGDIVSDVQTDTSRRTIRRAKGKLSRKQFNAEVAKAVRTGDSKIPEVKESAEFFRRELYDPLRDEMIAQKLLPEDVTVTTANNYLNRVWNKNAIYGNLTGFTRKVSTWLEDKDFRLFEESQSILDDLPGDSVEVKLANLKKQIDKASGEEKIRLEKQKTLINKSEFKEGLQFERQDYDDIAEQIAQRITGTPDGRLPYDWKLGDGFSDGTVTTKGTALRGPLRNRVFLIPDELVEEFLENDIENLAARYVQQTAADIELHKRFGDVQMTEQIKAIERDYVKLIRESDEAFLKKIDEAKTDKQKDKLEAQRARASLKLSEKRESDMTDIAGMRDRIRGVYGFDNSVWARIARSTRDLNYLRLLGGVTISSIPDIARISMAEGFVKTFQSGFGPLVANTKTFKIAASEAKSWGVGIDALVSGRADIIADVNDYTLGGNRVERGLRAATNQFSRFNLINHWTSGMKQLHAVTMQTSVFDGLSKGKFDKRLERLGIDEANAKNMWEQVKKHGKKENGVWITNAKNWDSPELERMWGAAVRKESDRVIIVPRQDKPLFMSTEMGKTVMQFRSFMLAATQRVFIAALQNQDHNTLVVF